MTPTRDEMANPTIAGIGDDGVGSITWTAPNGRKLMLVFSHGDSWCYSIKENASAYFSSNIVEFLVKDGLPSEAVAFFRSAQDSLLAAQRAEFDRELAAARYAPMGDNHHNAVLCPYCNPNGPLRFSTTPTTPEPQL